MKFSAVLASAGLVALVSAQSSTSPAPSAAPTSPYTDEQVKCLDGCDVEDVSCQAECFGNPGPNSQMVVDTTACVAKCDQGEGSEEDIASYSQCVRSCISSDFYSSTLGQSQGNAQSTASSRASSATSSAASAASTAASDASSSASDIAASASDAVSSASQSVEDAVSSASDAAASATSTDDDSGAAGLKVGLTGVVAVLAAVFAL